MNRNTDFRLAWMLVAVMLATGFFSAGIAAQPKNSAEWLERIARSARELRYTGVFGHQTSDGSVTTRETNTKCRDVRMRLGRPSRTLVCLTLLELRH